jgi:IMP cyclohydrolase
MVDLYEYLYGTKYPGRGIAVGRTPDSEHLRIAYFIMGRSANSRNRIFVEDGKGIRTKAFDESKVEDPSLIIYAPVKVLDDKTIVTNGDQTDTIEQYLKEGKTFEEALDTRTFEPDGPNFTPRISALVQGTSLKMSILKSDDNSDEAVLRYYYNYTDLPAWEGRLIHTYNYFAANPGQPLPSFVGEPVKWQVGHEGFDEFTDRLWDALDKDNKVSLFTREINVKTGETVSRIMNRNK